MCLFMKRIGYLVDFVPFWTRETAFVVSCLLFGTKRPFWKGVDSKRKEFAPTGSKVFTFRLDPFLEGNTISTVAFPEIVSIPRKAPLLQYPWKHLNSLPLVLLFVQKSLVYLEYSPPLSHKETL